MTSWLKNYMKWFIEQGLGFFSYFTMIETYFFLTELKCVLYNSQEILFQRTEWVHSDDKP